MRRGAFAVLLLAWSLLAAAAEKGGKADMELGGMSVLGHRELPKSLFVVPWRPPELGSLVGRPTNSLLNEAVEPVDREEFLRELEYYEALSGQGGR